MAHSTFDKVTEAALTARRIMEREWPGIPFVAYESAANMTGAHRLCVIEMLRELKLVPGLMSDDRKTELLSCRPNWMDALDDARECMTAQTLNAIGTLAP